MTPRELLEETKCKIYVGDVVLASAPMEDVEPVEFFNLGKFVFDDELEKEYANRGLIPANLPSLVASHKMHEFVGTHWKDDEGKWCFATFGRWGGERSVRVDRYGYGWDGYWWFCGVKKKP